MPISNACTVQKNYVSMIYENIYVCIRQYIQNSPIWVSIDELTYANGKVIIEKTIFWDNQIVSFKLRAIRKMQW